MAKKTDPYSNILKIEREINRIFENIFSKNTREFFLEEGWVPLVDVCEKKNEILVKVELPGVHKNDIKISLSGDRLEIRGTKRGPKMTKMRFIRLEREYGRFHRILLLPQKINPSHVKASLSNGILTIRLNKVIPEKEKEIEVEIE